MRLEEQLQSYTVRYLKELVKICPGPGPDGTRKEHMVGYLVERLTRPESLEEVWESLDSLSRKAVAAAYHAGGELDEEAFAAQHGELPWRRGRDPLSIMSYHHEPHPVDLLIHRRRLPRDLIDPLAGLVPPPERFELEGLAEAPATVEVDGETFTLRRADTEEAGLHDLAACLRLREQGALKHSTASTRLTPTSVRNFLEDLLEGDFFPHRQSMRPGDAIRPLGLDAFVSYSGLLKGNHRDELSEGGEEFLLRQDPEVLLEAFEEWAAEGAFDELDRIPAIKGKNAKRTSLTPPGKRREAVVEGLSWCPTGVWIPVPEFQRALTVWQFDLELDSGRGESPLSVEDPFYGGRIYYVGREGRELIKGLYIGAVLMESLGSIGALDLLYLPPELYETYETPYSRYDCLLYFRINPLGAYLFGQKSEYSLAHPPHAPLFTIDGATDGEEEEKFTLTLTAPGVLTPNLRRQLGQFTVEAKQWGNYLLDKRRVLETLESGGEIGRIDEFLHRRHEGSLPPRVQEWIEEIRESASAFEYTSDALLVKAHSRELVEMILDEPSLRRFVGTLGMDTLVIPSKKEKTFRKRLKELGYLLNEQ